MKTHEAAARIAELALSFPEAYEDRPFGDFPVYKVPPNKLFALAPADDGAVLVTLKGDCGTDRPVTRWGWTAWRATSQSALQ